jgi:hypothetical protein
VTVSRIAAFAAVTAREALSVYPEEREHPSLNSRTASAVMPVTIEVATAGSG